MSSFPYAHRTVAEADAQSHRDHSAATSEGMRRSWARRLADQEGREAASERGKAMRRTGMAAGAVEKRRATLAARFWCPEPYRELNAQLCSAGFTAKERREIVAQQAEKDARA